MQESITLTCSTHLDPFDCPDVLVTYIEKFDEYALIVHDGGTGAIPIKFCPWCGTNLPQSKRDLWFDTLTNLGFQNPTDEPIPEKFHTDAWYRRDN